jgi:hypothetical protein
MGSFLSKVLFVLGIFGTVVTDLIITIQDFVGGNIMGGLQESGIILGIIGGLFHLHLKFDFLGINVDTDSALPADPTPAPAAPAPAGPAPAVPAKALGL